MPGATAAAPLCTRSATRSEQVGCAALLLPWQLQQLQQQIPWMATVPLLLAHVDMAHGCSQLRALPGRSASCRLPAERGVMFWTPATNERSLKYVKRFVNLAVAGELTCLVTKVAAAAAAAAAAVSAAAPAGGKPTCCCGGKAAATGTCRHVLGPSQPCCRQQGSAQAAHPERPVRGVLCVCVTCCRVIRRASTS